MLLVNFTHINDVKEYFFMTDILENGYSYDTVLSESNPMNTNMAGFRDGFHKEPFKSMCVLTCL